MTLAISRGCRTQGEAAIAGRLRALRVVLARWEKERVGAAALDPKE